MLHLKACALRGTRTSEHKQQPCITREQAICCQRQDFWTYCGRAAVRAGAILYSLNNGLVLFDYLMQVFSILPTSSALSPPALEYNFAPH